MISPWIFKAFDLANTIFSGHKQTQQDCGKRAHAHNVFS